MEANERRVWFQGEWVVFPLSCLTTDQPTFERWVLVLDALAAVCPDDAKPRRGYNQLTAGHLNAATETDEFTGEVCRWILDRVKTKVRRWQRDLFVAPLRTEQLLENRSDQSVDELLTEWLGWEATAPAVDVKPPGDRRKVYVLADLHGCPNEEIVRRIIRDAVDFDGEVQLILAGDLYDVFCSSRAGKINGVPFRAASKEVEQLFHWETTNLVTFLSLMNTSFPGKISIIRGNHDEAMAKFVGPTPGWVLREFFADPLTTLAGEFDNVEMEAWRIPHVGHSGSLVGGFAKNPYASLVGDVVISHMNFTGVDAARKLWNWVQAKRIQHGLGDVRVVLQAHTHSMNLLRLHDGHIVAATCGFAGNVETLRYQMDGYIPWLSTAVPGYITLEQHSTDGKWTTDLATVQAILV